LAGYIYRLGQAILTMDTFSTYTGFELRQQILANAVIVALLTESVRKVVDGRPLCLRQWQLRGPQLLARCRCRCGRPVAVQRAFATDFSHSE
jgi:hypothetical protein